MATQSCDSRRVPLIKIEMLAHESRPQRTAGISIFLRRKQPSRKAPRWFRRRPRSRRAREESGKKLDIVGAGLSDRFIHKFSEAGHSK